MKLVDLVNDYKETIKEEKERKKIEKVNNLLNLSRDEFVKRFNLEDLSQYNLYRGLKELEVLFKNVDVIEFWRGIPDVDYQIISEESYINKKRKVLLSKTNLNCKIKQGLWYHAAEDYHYAITIFEYRGHTFFAK